MGEALKATVFLVDDDAAVLKALVRLLVTAGYEARPFTSAADFMKAHDPSVPGCAVVDLTMAEVGGLQLQAMLQSNGVERPIVFLTGTGDISSSVRAMKAGAVDFLTKPVDRHNLFTAIGLAIDADRRARTLREEAESVNDRLATLTRREREVLHHVVAGRLNKQIANSLGTVEKTIKVHRGRMMAKLGMRCVADLVRLSERAHLAPPPSNKPHSIGP